VGMRLKRSLPMGAVLTPAYLESPMLVRRGDQVVIRADLPGMDVRASGTALGSAAAGERLRVRNESSGRIVEAIVTARGEVRTAM
jgi:flagella basal body P-ring formation protein FlgA